MFYFNLKTGNILLLLFPFLYIYQDPLSECLSCENTSSSMDVFGLFIPDKILTNYDLYEYATRLKIPHFRGVFMRDTLPKRPHEVECVIVNLNTSAEKGSH